MTTLRARYDGRVLVPEGEIDLAAGTIIELQILNRSNDTASTQETVTNLRQAMGTRPQLLGTDVDVLEEAIARGELPVDEVGPFHDR